MLRPFFVAINYKIAFHIPDNLRLFCFHSPPKYFGEDATAEKLKMYHQTLSATSGTGEPDDAINSQTVEQAECSTCVELGEVV